MNSVEFFERRLTQLDDQRLNALLGMQIDGPQLFLASILTSLLVDMVELEINTRRAQRQHDSHHSAGVWVA